MANKGGRANVSGTRTKKNLLTPAERKAFTRLRRKMGATAARKPAAAKRTSRGGGARSLSRPRGGKCSC